MTDEEQQIVLPFFKEEIKSCSPESNHLTDLSLLSLPSTNAEQMVWHPQNYTANKCK